MISLHWKIITPSPKAKFIILLLLLLLLLLPQVFLPELGSQAAPRVDDPCKNLLAGLWQLPNPLCITYFQIDCHEAMTKFFLGCKKTEKKSYQLQAASNS